MEVPSRFTVAKKITLLLVVMIAVSILIVAIFCFYLSKNDALTYNADKALSIASSIAAAIDGDEFSQIMETEVKNESWQRAKAFVDKVKKNTRVRYLYVLDKTYDENVRYFAEGYDPETNFEDEFDLGDPEAVEIFADEMYETLRTGETAVTGAYPSGDFGEMVSGFAPIKDSSGRTVGVVGVDLDVRYIMGDLSRYQGPVSVLFAVLLIIFTGFILLFRRLIRRIISRPIRQLTEASDKIARGDVRIDLDIRSRDEIGMLAESFKQMVSHTKKQAQAVNALSEGNLTVTIEPRSERDIMNLSLRKMVETLNGIFAEVRRGSDDLLYSSEKIAQTARTLAEGAARQTAGMSEIRNTVQQVSQSAEESARQAAAAARTSEVIQNIAATGSTRMEKMLEAVSRIEASSKSIGQVIHTIEDIAFQTNLLALNASVEAARAGVHGQGFAIVADEVGALAARSADSAGNTSTLVDESIRNVQTGVEIAGETAGSLQEIIRSLDESSKIIEEISVVARIQSGLVQQITGALQEFSHVLDRNAQLSEESAETSNEMQHLAGRLDQLLSRFRLQESAPPAGKPAPTPERH